MEAGMRWGRVRAVVYRQTLALRRSPHRWFDVFVWPLVDVLLFGALGVFMAEGAGSGERLLAYLLAGTLLWHVIYQSEIAVSTGFMEEMWSRNVLNLMVTPLTELEYLAGVALSGVLRLVIGIATVALGCLVFFAFDVTDLGLGMVPVAAVLLVVGWVIALFVIGLLLRFGEGAEVLAWGILFIVLPLSGVFTPIEALPGGVQPIARLLPTTHAFQAARDLVDGKPMPWGELGWATLGCAVALAAGFAFLLAMLRVFRRRGYVTRFS
jgi:ABC-2 type transport system permease protein